MTYLHSKDKKLQGMWTKYAYNVGGLLFTLDEIEHGILRCNKGHPKDENPMFEDEARKSLSLSFLDPRIHFALNCGATSCPPIRLLDISRLNKIAIFRLCPRFHSLGQQIANFDLFTAKRKLERLQFSTSSSFVKI